MKWKSPEKRTWRNCEEKFKTCHNSLITEACFSLRSAHSDSISSVPSVPSAAVSWPEKLLFVVLPACSQEDITLHSSPLSGPVWVGVCDHVGRCTPHSWKCSKISLQHYCHLHNWAFLFLISSIFFLQNQTFSVFLFPLWQQVYLQHLPQRVDFILHCHTSMQQMPRRHEALTVTLWFWEIAIAHRGKGSTAMKRLPHSTLLKINHILCQCCKQKVK